MLTDAEFREILDHYERPWSGFRKVRKGVMKRIGRHMRLLGSRSAAEYIAAVDTSPAELENLQAFLRVTISRFYRDKGVWKCLEEHVIPDLLHLAADSLRVWSAGCACGEEVYSLKILWHYNFFSFSRLEITATDGSPACLQRAREGRYGKSSLKELDDDRIAQCFLRMPQQAAGDEYFILPHFKNDITWQQHDLLQPPPAYGFHIILLRNSLLTYYRDPLKSKLLRGIVRSLLPGGYLVTGCHESIPIGFCSLFENHACLPVYRLSKS